MISIMDRVKGNKKIIGALKILLSACIFAVILQSLFIDGINPYYSYKDYDYQNRFGEGEGRTLGEYSEVVQTFTARGNILDNVSLYIGEARDATLTVTVSSSAGDRICKSEVQLSQCKENAWNKIGLTSANLSRGETYSIAVSSDSGLGSLYCSGVDIPEIFDGCKAGDGDVDDALAVGLQFTYRYLTLGSIFELVLKTMISLLIGMAACACIVRFEDMYRSFKESDRKKGFSYALYFSVSLVLLYNPLDSIRNEVAEFKRVIGIGIITNVDVSRRISNFNRWFFLFGIVFLALLLFFHNLLQKERRGEADRVKRFLDHFMILANCSLVIRCINFFSDESSVSSVFHFSAYAVMMIALIALCYICLKLERNISANAFARINLAGLSFSIPVAVFIALEWDSGKVLLGIEAIVAIMIICFCKFGRRIILSRHFEAISNAGVLCLSLIPLLTSLYMELIHIFNQHKIFVAYPARWYKVLILLVIGFFCGLSILLMKKKNAIRNWKTWAYPSFALGVAFLSIQIPLSSTYDLDLFESANYSVLISDFLNNGTIPIVEHYGGHMMTSVWEGILYGLINGDHVGAAVSPYSSLMGPLLVVLFFYLVKKIWNEDIALPVALLFPFIGSWSYYGMGMLVCFAAMGYVRKNSYARAALLWAACVWCALYRLDLGFSFGFAAMISLAVYIVVNRNWKAVKELAMTLAGWGILGGVLWSIICMAKGIHPFNRLIEFLMISMSNQNWAGGGVGDAGKMLFSWSYLFIPFTILICVIYTVFSKNMREHIGDEKWMLILILGWSYFANYSRGLVRHSVAEMNTTIILWCGYLFLAVFLCCYKNKKKLFLPAFMILILCNTLFLGRQFSSGSTTDAAVSAPGPIIKSWESGRFEELKRDRRVVKRVRVNDDLEKYVEKYEIVLDALLDEEETFIDFMNKTLLYSLLGKRNPAYVSQSPLQLSGEFSQTEFIKEMEGIPLVLMPVDAENKRCSTSLDGIANAVRYYKVAEHIYQNYIPLCRYGSDYAIWCVKKDYNHYKAKLSNLIAGTNYLPEIIGSETISTNNIELSHGKNAAVIVKHIGADPFLSDLQNVIDLSEYRDKNMNIRIEYETDVPGTMQMYYTNDEGESYSDAKVVSAEIANRGTAVFTIPVTKYSKLRLDIPEGSKMTLKSLSAGHAADYIDYGYDGPAESDDGDGNVSYSYTGSLHNYSISRLPGIWAEKDREDAASHSVLADALYEDGTFVFDRDSIRISENGNYMKFAASYDGTDEEGLYRDDDEQIEGAVILGSYENGIFQEKCRYSMLFQEGEHEYLLRCSTDYYWHTGDINAVQISSDEDLHAHGMQILEGD